MTARCYATPHDVEFVPRQWEPTAVLSDGRTITFPVWSADAKRATAVAVWLAEQEGVPADAIECGPAERQPTLFDLAALS